MAYKIPLFDLNFSDEEGQAVLDTIKTNWISTGPMCLKFESKFADLLKVNHATTLSNCTTALHLAYDVLNIGEGDEVICPSLTFVATVNAIRYVGAIPIFCDVISEENFNIDPIKIRSLITPKTKALVVVHFAGFPCDMDEIMSIAEEHNLRVIEDACHGPLSEYKGKKLGTIGDVGCFSFFSNKNISTGEGGMIITNNAELDRKIRLKRSHGMTTMSYQRAAGHSTEYDVVEVGYNYRMDDMRAAIGVVQLGKIEADLAKRAQVRSYYLELLQELEDQIFIPFKNNTEFVSNYVMLTVLKEPGKRNEVRNRIHELGVQTSVHYPAIHRFSIYEDFAKNSDLRITEYIADNEITLPMYANLSYDDVKFIVQALKTAL